MKKTRHFEGDRLGVTDATGETEEYNYELVSGVLEVEDQDLIDRGPVSLLEGLQKMVEELSSQQSKLILERLNNVTAKTGNTVDAGGRKINPDLLLKALEKIEMRFTEDGQPVLPTLVVHPDQYKRLIEKLPEWEKDKRYNRNFNELIKKKRQEWHDRESHRKLVD